MTVWVSNIDSNLFPDSMPEVAQIPTYTYTDAHPQHIIYLLSSYFMSRPVLTAVTLFIFNL